jgi:hypothetical protein
MHALPVSQVRIHFAPDEKNIKQHRLNSIRLEKWIFRETAWKSISRAEQDTRPTTTYHAHAGNLRSFHVLTNGPLQLGILEIFTPRALNNND